MKENIALELSKELSLDIIKFYKKIKKEENVLSKQVLRSITSIGANVHEAYYAQTKKDFITKLSISLKECFESEYWLELLHKSDYLNDDDYNKLNNKCGTIRRILIKSCKTAKSDL